ncbi:hypothetical protein D6833_00325 [Candidatus Parcubacteria bacterium]|nr:MAG: hypothetical protein D6833_00325 [Candidatus Parcubacteria bacterium]
MDVSIERLRMTIIVSQNLERKWFVHVRRGDAGLGDWQEARRFLHKKGIAAPFAILYEAKSGVSGLYCNGDHDDLRINEAVLYAALYADFLVEDGGLVTAAGQSHVMALADVSSGAASIVGSVTGLPYWYDDGGYYLLEPVVPSSMNVVLRVPSGLYESREQAIESMHEMLSGVFGHDVVDRIVTSVPDYLERPDLVRRYVRSMVSPDAFHSLSGVRRIRVGCTPVHIRKASPPEDVVAEFDAVQRKTHADIEYLLVPLHCCGGQIEAYLARRGDRYYLAMRAEEVDMD